METLTQPTLLLKPFAESGDKNTIPVTNTDASNPQLADLTNGFPQITSETPANNGLPPERKDFNGLGYLTTTYDYFYQAGGTFTFNQTVSDAIGGYPLNARLYYQTSNGEIKILQSLKGNNTSNFNTNPAYIDDGVNWKSVIPTLGEIASDFLTIDLMNITQEGKEKITSWGSPDYSSGITAYTNFEAPANGYLRVQAYINGGTAVGYIDGVEVYRWIDDGNSRGTSFIPIKKGSIWTNGGGFEIQQFFPCIGAEYVPPVIVPTYCYRNFDLGRYWYYYSENLYTNVIPVGTTLYYTSNFDVASDSSDLTSSLVITANMSVERYSAGDISE